MSDVKVGMLLSRLRDEEKQLLKRFAMRGVDPVRLADRTLTLELTDPATIREKIGVDLVLDRCLAHGRAAVALQALDIAGIRSVNTRRAAIVADDKVESSLVLGAAGIPTLRTWVTFSPESALDLLDEIGYPAVLKPVSGSWGRLLSKVNSRESARTLLEHKRDLGSYHHSTFYVQEYVKKPGRDLRIFIVGDDIIGASYRTAEHWITNVARGAVSEPCPITPEIAEISMRAARAIGVEIAGVDLVETEDGMKVIEVNGGAEFKGLMQTTETDIAGAIADYVIQQAEIARQTDHTRTNGTQAGAVSEYNKHAR